MWVGQCLMSTTNGADVNVTQGSPTQAVASVQLGITADGFNRAIVVIYLPYDKDALNSPTQKTWMSAQEFNQATPHANLLSN
jgi:hypothetical protein